jgi:hypothetical protein
MNSHPRYKGGCFFVPVYPIHSPKGFNKRRTGEKEEDKI